MQRCLALAALAVAPMLGALPLPTAPQLAWQRGEIMALVHFSMASYFRDGDPGCGSDNWEGESGSSNPNSFAPTALNVSQWVDSMVAIQATEAVLTAKHGCGFYLWDTAVQLPRGGGTYPYHVNLERYGDVLAQFVAATSARGIGHGFYYSLTNNFFLNVFAHSAHGNSSALPGQFPVTQAEFEAIALASVTELWTRFGNQTELWFDGSYTTDMQAELTALLQRTQPNAVAFGGLGISSNPARWCGTEAGSPPGYPTIWSTGTENGGQPPAEGVPWNPSGVDLTLQVGDHWFYTPGLALRPLGELIDVYHKSVGCNGKLELDFAISRTGQLDPRHVAAYAAFGAWQRSCYGAPLATAAPGASLVSVLDLGSGGAPVLVDRVMLREDLAGGQNVNGYLLEWEDSSSAGEGGASGWQSFGSGTTVGNKKIHLRAEGAVNATSLRLTLAPSAFPPPYAQFLTTFAAFAPGPCAVGPSPAKAVRFSRGGACLVSNATFPCPGGAGNACPVFLGSCSDPTALWDDSDGTLQNLHVAQSTGQLAGIVSAPILPAPCMKKGELSVLTRPPFPPSPPSPRRTLTATPMKRAQWPSSWAWAAARAPMAFTLRGGS